MLLRTPLRCLLLATTVLAAPALAQAPEPSALEKVQKAIIGVTGSPMANLDTDMQRVINTYITLMPRPIMGDMSPGDARQQPTLGDAAKKIMVDNGQSDQPKPGVTTKDTTYDGAKDKIPARIYTPDGATGPLPVVLYFHGGGFVIANIDTYDASARAIAKQANAVVVSAHYRQAPENKFPASHDDAVAAYKWVLAKAGEWGGDPKKVAVVGESAGANLAMDVAIAARDQNLQAPVYQGLIYPVAGSAMDTPSYEANDASLPLNRPMMKWFVKHEFASEAEAKDPRLDLVGGADLKGLPPATVITAEIDPLRSEGQALADKLKGAGVAVNAKDYAGVTHEFFGLGDLVADAADAQATLSADLKAAFAGEGGAPKPAAQ